MPHLRALEYPVAGSFFPAYPVSEAVCFDGVMPPIEFY
jgi:hypothetical protein